VHVRIAEHAGRIYLDVADWRAVEIGTGWMADDWIAAGSLPPDLRECCRFPDLSEANRLKR
jgi:hypothetical protein